eukprot:2721650-Lingulodinium_polyedra.AAC.1
MLWLWGAEQSQETWPTVRVPGLEVLLWNKRHRARLKARAANESWDWTALGDRGKNGTSWPRRSRGLGAMHLGPAGNTTAQRHRGIAGVPRAGGARRRQGQQRAL